MVNQTTECPYCGDDMVVTFIDVGDTEPLFVMALMCTCGEWLEREMECNVDAHLHDIYSEEA